MIMTSGSAIAVASHPRHYTIEAAGLVREPAMMHLHSLNFIEEYIQGTIGDGSKWQRYNVLDGYGTICCSYSVSVEDGAYITHWVDTNILASNNQIKYRDMIIENYRDAGGDPKTLEFIGTQFIINREAQDAVRATFASVQIDYKSALKSQVKIMPGPYGTWDDCKEITERNPFAEGPLKMVAERQAALGVNVRVSRMHVIAVQDEPFVNSGVEHNFHMIVRLMRP
jgi:hypothetical protein